MQDRARRFVAHLRSIPRPVLAGVVLALAVPSLVVAGSLVRAQDTVHLCYVPGSGTVYRIGEPGLKQACAPAHIEFTMNVQGPEGEQGEQGPPGEQGPQGAPGPVTGWERVSASVDLTTAEPRLNVTAVCPQGKVATGGGYQLVHTEDVRIVFSLPSADGSGWGIDAELMSGASGSAVATAVCVEGATSP